MSSTADELRRAGSATVYEAGGRGGFVDADLVQLVPGSRAAGPARTVRCGQDDSLMVHAVMAELQPGEVLVLSMPEPRPVALVGHLLATQAKAQGAAAILVDAAVRDAEELAGLALPIWARWIRVRGADKEIAGTIGEPVTVRRTACGSSSSCSGWRSRRAPAPRCTSGDGAITSATASS